MGVHSVPPWTLKLRNLSFLGPDRMDNLLRDSHLVREVRTAHPSAMMGRLMMMMMVAAVVKASHPGITGKGRG
jgi:hypothetical protein